jgi:flagellar motor protein MotB
MPSSLKNAQRALCIGVLTSALGACAHTASEQLVDARHAYDDAAASPARQHRPNELEAARVALERAEDAHDEAPRSQREKRLANEAEHKALSARAHGEAAVAEQEARHAEREAAQARARAQEAKAESASHEASAERSEVHAEARAEPAHDANSSGAERSTKSRARRSNLALQNLASVATVREEPRGVVITLAGSLLFPSGQQELSPIARQNLDKVAHALAEQPAESKFLVAGHTDNSGTASQNKQLSTQRARAVADYLVQSGIERERIDVEGYGETRPVVTNNSAEAQAENRRVEIVIEPSQKTASLR